MNDKDVVDSNGTDAQRSPGAPLGLAVMLGVGGLAFGIELHAGWLVLAGLLAPIALLLLWLLGGLRR